MPDGHNEAAAISRTNKSAVSNGKRLFINADVDGRSPAARRFRDLYSQHVADLGGPEMLSEFQMQMCRRCAFLEVEAELLEAERMQGKEIDLETYTSMMNAHGRAAGRVGLRRVAKPVQTLDEYMAGTGSVA